MPPCLSSRMRKPLKAKDTTIAIMGNRRHLFWPSLPTYPDGFPRRATLDEFTRRTGFAVSSAISPTPGNRRNPGLRRRTHQGPGSSLSHTSSRQRVPDSGPWKDIVPPETLLRILPHCPPDPHRGTWRGPCHVSRPLPETAAAIQEPQAAMTFNRAAVRGLLDQLRDNGKDVIGVGQNTRHFAGKGLYRIYLHRETKTASTKPLPIWTKSSKASALSTWLTMTCLRPPQRH